MALIEVVQKDRHNLGKNLAGLSVPGAQGFFFFFFHSFIPLFFIQYLSPGGREKLTAMDMNNLIIRTGRK